MILNNVVWYDFQKLSTREMFWKYAKQGFSKNSWKKCFWVGWSYFETQDWIVQNYGEIVNFLGWMDEWRLQKTQIAFFWEFEVHFCVWLIVFGPENAQF